MNKKVVVVYAQHGNERLGALAAVGLERAGIKTLLGNPRAFLAGKQFVNSDLNRSFKASSTHNYETARARQILAEIAAYELVLDIHTSHSSVGKVAIVTEFDPKILKTVAALGFSKLAVMPKHLAENSLIGNVKRGISLEYGENTARDQATMDELVENIKNLPFASRPNVNVEVYYIKDKLPAQYKQSGLRNYKFSSGIEGYPFLVGKSTYKDYAGFFADRKKTVSIGADNDK